MAETRYIGITGAMIVAFSAVAVSVAGAALGSFPITVAGAACAAVATCMSLVIQVAGNRSRAKTATRSTIGSEDGGEHRFETVVLESLSEGVVACDADGNVIYANNAAHDLQGIPREATMREFLRTRNLYAADGVTPLPDDLTPLSRCAREGDLDDEHIKYARGDEVRDALCNSRRILAPDGSLAGAVTAFRDITDLIELSKELQRERDQLAFLAGHDELTGLLNRRAFEERLEQHLALAERYGPAGALLMIDIDNLKHVNDRHGHAAGDSLIVAASDAIRRRLRDTDMVFRIGGDEFAVLLPHGDRAQAEVVAREILKHVARCRARIDDGSFAGTSASIGIAAIADFDRPAKGAVKASADAAMYAAKERGRDRYIVATGELLHHRAA